MCGRDHCRRRRSQCDRTIPARGKASLAAIAVTSPHRDEPTPLLDDGNRATVVSLSRSLADEGCIVVVATHDVGMVRACDRQFSLVSGLVEGYEPVPY